jgi:hypothetical protein
LGSIKGEGDFDRLRDYQLLKEGEALMMEAARTSETLVNFYQTTRCYNPEDSNLPIQTCSYIPQFYMSV